MSSCPNFDDSRYQELVNQLGELEAYKYWASVDGDLSNMPTPTEIKVAVKKALEHVGKIPDAYQTYFKENTAQSLKEIAEQLNSGEVTARETRSTFGKDISDIAQSLYPTVNPQGMAQLIGKLQAEGVVGKRVANLIYEIDPDDYNPAAQEERAFEVAQMINSRSDKELVKVVTTKDGFGIKIDPKTYKFIQQLDPGDVESYKDYLSDNLYTRKDKPTTSELLNNVGLMSKDFKRSDLTNLARLFYKYLHKNPTLAVNIVDSFNGQPDFDESDKAYYRDDTNTINFARDRFATGTLEKEMETLLHEFGHALTVQPWIKAYHNVQLTPEEANFKNIVDSYYNYFKAKDPSAQTLHPFEDSQEFLQAALTDGAFRDRMKNIRDLPNTKDNLFMSFMKSLLKGFLRLFGINPEREKVETIDPERFEQSLFRATSDYLASIDPSQLGNYLKEPGRNYGLSFAVTAEQDYASEREKMKAKFTPEMKERIKSTITKSINTIKSFGSKIRSIVPESQEEFKEIFKQLRKLEDPEANIDQVDFFVDFTSEIGAILNVAHDKISKLYYDESIDDSDFKLKEYGNIIYAARNFDPILQSINQIHLDIVRLKIPEFTKEVDNIINKRANIESIYSKGIFPLVTDKFVNILDDSSKEALQIANGEVEKLHAHRELALKNNNKARVKTLENQIDKLTDDINKNFVLNADKIQSWLRGEMGDSNIFQTWLLAGVSSKNPIAAGLSKFIRDLKNEVSPRILSLQNQMQTMVNQYEQRTGISAGRIEDFNRKLVQTHQVITDKNEDGSYNYETRYALTHQFNNGHIKELQKFIRDFQGLKEQKEKLEKEAEPNLDKINEVVASMKKLKEDQRKFKREFLEQEYKPEVHEALDMVYKDLGGYSAHDYIKAQYDNINDIETSIAQTSDEGRVIELFDQLDDAQFSLRRLRSLYDKSSDSKEFKVANLLKDRDKLLGQYSDFKLTDKGRMKFEADMTRLKRKLDKKEITKERYERELENNTISELTKEYWDKKKDIIAKLADVMNELGVKTEKNEEIQGLYSQIEDIVKAHRDNSGIINGQEMTDKELSDVKNIEETLERTKDRIANIMGLSKLERMELSNLYEKSQEIQDAFVVERNPQRVASLEEEFRLINDSIQTIEGKKKNLNPKLLRKYFDIIKQLSDLDESASTKYYMDELAERTEQEKAKVDVNAMPINFFAEGVKYQKIGEQWYATGVSGMKKIDTSKAQSEWQAMNGEVNLKSSDWWKTNHISRFRWFTSPSYDPTAPESYGGEWREVEDPIYAWRQTRPKDSKYVSEGQPSLKYKTRIYKDEYKNSNYKLSITGEIQPKLIGAPDQRFVNADYNKLDADTRTYLDFLTKTYMGAQETLPYGRRPGFDLPSIRKDTTERFLATSLTEKKDALMEHLGQIARLWSDDLARNPQDADILYGYNDDTSGIVPMKYLGHIDAKDQSLDLSHMILAFSIAAMEREQLQKALPFASAVKDILNDPANKPVKTKGGKVVSMASKFLPKGMQMAQRSSTNNTTLQVNEIIKTEIYGELMKDTPITKLVNTTLGVGAKLLLGGNLVSSLQNYANAFTQSIMETESKVSGNFTLKNFGEAQKLYYSAMHEMMADIGKVGNKSYYNQFFDYFGGINLKQIGKAPKPLPYGKVRELVSILSIPNQITEHMLNYQLAMAVGLNYRVKKGSEMIPIIDAFTLDNGKLKVKDGVTVTEQDRKNFTAKLNSSARRINGEYGDKILAEKYVLGKAALFMNRYAIPFIVKRYGARQWDIQDGIREEGYWRLIGKTILKDLKSKSVPVVGGWKYYTNQEKTALMRGTTEFGFTVMFFALMSALGGGDDKHLRENNPLANELIYALKGIQQQNEAFMPVPGVGFDDLVRKIQNPFPILGKVKNALDLIQDSAHYLYYQMGLPGVDRNDVYFSKAQGWHKPGDLKLTSDIQKLMSIPYRLEQYLHPDQAVKNIDAISRIK